MRKYLFFLVAVVSLVPYLATAKEQVQQPEKGFVRGPSEEKSAEKFMVATANPIATRVGFDILRKGGNATDAAIAIQLVLNVVEPQSSGMGGGAFALYWDSNRGRLFSYDGRETAPEQISHDYFLNSRGEPRKFWEVVPGGGSVGVPGTLALMEFMHKRHGSEQWSELFKPAMRLARDGFPISPRLAASIENAKRKKLDLFKETKKLFFNANGQGKKTGEILKNKQLYESLKLISKGGAKVFYGGEIGQEIIKSIQNSSKNPGLMRTSDLLNYRVKERTPVCVKYRGYDVCGMGPPSSGGITVGQILGVIENSGINRLEVSEKSMHLFIEASKLAYADRGLYIADADFLPVPTEGLLDPGYLRERFKLIGVNPMQKALPGSPKGSKGLLRALQLQEEKGGTTHFSIVDSYGNALSLTSTIETGFGSRLMAGGFLLNNELTDFSFRPIRNGRLVANRPEGGKRPRSSMAPTIVLKDNRPALLLGSPGGSRIISYVAQAIIAVLDQRMSPKQAVNSGHIVNRNGITEIEEGSDAIAFLERLKGLGHEIKVRNLNSGIQMILVEKDGTLRGAADPRREGSVMGE